jgi:hypothetical protein
MGTQDVSLLWADDYKVAVEEDEGMRTIYAGPVTLADVLLRQANNDNNTARLVSVRGSMKLNSQSHMSLAPEVGYCRTMIIR